MAAIVRGACLLAVLFAGALAADTHARVTVTPIAKVVQMLNDMIVKAQAEKELEANKFTTFYQWCDDQTRIKNKEIKKETEDIEMLEAKIGKAAALIRSLTDRIEELDEDVGRWNKDKTSASDVRGKEKADFTATSTDYSESLEALAGAVATLKKQAYGRSQAELAQVLLQVQNLQRVPASSKRVLAAFLQQGQPDADMANERIFREAPEAYGYEFQSGGVVDMLEKLEAQFSTKKYDLEKEEMTAQHAFEAIFQQLTDNIENAEHEIQKKTELRAETQKLKAETEADLKMVTADRAEDKTYLEDMTGLCASKKSAFESREQLRADELVALKKAVEIMSTETVSGAGEKYLPTLLQLRGRGHVSLAQLRSGRQQNPLQARIASFLADRARTSNSRLLSLISQRVASDPFDAVKKMIKDLIVKLMEEATSETEHKGWCDTELTTNKQTRDAKTEEVGTLTAEVEDLTSEIAQLTQDIADLAAKIKELQEAIAAATAERAESKEKNEKTIKDAKEAQVAVEEATAVLKDFYAKSAQATALAQQSPAEDAPETFTAPYKGLLPEGGNVLDFLEVILTDFTRLESETAASEATEVDEYKKYMFESEKDKALKENEKGHKEARKSDKETALHSAQGELKATQEQLEKAVAYYEKLKPSCVDSGITYEERVKRREEEMQSLQEALKILSGEDLS